MSKINPANLHMSEAPFEFVTPHTPKEIDAEPDYFLPSKKQLRPRDSVRVFSQDGKGFSLRAYRVVSSGDNPLVVLPEGDWMRFETPPPRKAEPAPGAVTDREVFVPVGCDPGDLDQHNQLKGKPVWAAPHRRWEVRGESSGRVYATGVADKETAELIRIGQAPYRLESMERTA